MSTEIIPETALGESQANYSAADRALDEAAEAAMRPLPVWQERIKPPVPDNPKIEHELRLSCGERVVVSPWCSSTDKQFWAYIGISKRLTAASIEDGRAKAVPMVIDLLERALADLRFYQTSVAAHDAPAGDGQEATTEAVAS